MKFILVIASILFSIFFVLGIDYSKNINMNKSKLDKTKTYNDGFEILTRTVSEYRRLNSYESNGITVYKETFNGLTKESPKTKFSLSFKSPEDFIINWRFDNSETINNLTITSQSLVLEKDNKISKVYERINDAVYDVSSEDLKSRFFLLKLLAFNEKFISPLKNIQRVEDETIDETNCYKISAEVYGVATDAKANFTYWIEKDSFLVKRIQKEISLEDLKLTTTEDYLDIKFE